jgi:hypothetical protein
MLSSHNRYKYSGIDTRPKYRWPGGKSLAIYVALNAEHFPFGAPGGIDLDRGPSRGASAAGCGANTATASAAGGSPRCSTTWRSMSA